MNMLTKLWLVRRLNKQFYGWDKDTLQKHQEQRVSWILKHAAEQSPYYNRLLAGPQQFSLTAVPLMDKATMMEHFNQLNTAGLSKDELMEFLNNQDPRGTPGLYGGQFSVGLSSGTSGNKGLTLLAQDERQLYGCLLWARNGIPRQVKKPYRVLFAIRTNNPAYMEVGSFGVKLVYVDYTRSPEALVELINEKKLNILAGPPSLLAMLAARRDLIRPPIETIIAYAEVLESKTKTSLEETFGAPVVQIYQGAEGFIGSTCRAGNMHINEDIVLVEEQEAGDSLGHAKKVVLTDLYRTTQPIIRYALNDLLEIDHRGCTCGSCFRVIKKIHGRADDIFHLAGPDGKVRFLFPDYVQRSIIRASDDILEYQAIQHALGSIEIRLVVKEGAGLADIQNAVCDNLQQWAQKIGGQLGRVSFNTKLPERNPQSNKLIRVVRRF
ncbi:MAG: hypothetical protein VR67_03035 [Peptococcaceae bacterium BRH_c8a]|nr:MAG: hypothetical protein VR67_03035 [Peptococcaceae bacterium BRH_c8a]